MKGKLFQAGRYLEGLERGTHRRKDWRSKTEREGSPWGRVSKEMEGIPSSGKGEEGK